MCEPTGKFLAPCRWRLLLLALVALANAGIVLAQSPLEDFRVEQPRPYGHQLGARFEQRVTFALRGAYALKVDALPAGGRVSAWLALAPPVVEQRWGGRVTYYVVRFIYQVVNVAPNEPEIAVPSQVIQYANEAETLQALVPATRVRVNMLGDASSGTLQAARVPVARTPAYAGLMLAVLALVVGFAGLAYVRWGLPSATRAPFATALARLRRLRSVPWEDDGYRDALVVVHHAFNDTARSAVFAESLEAFFTTHERYVQMRGEIATFFAHSNAFFFAPDTAADRGQAYSRAELEHFVRQCHDIERGLR